MHTLYMVYDENGKVTDFVVDNVSTTQSFISLDRGPLSYVQSVVDNLNAYIKKNGDLTVENPYLSQVRHGQFDETYGEIQDKRTDNPNYTFQGNTQPTSQPVPQQPQQSTSTPQPSEPTKPTTSTPQPKPSEPAPASAAPASTPSK